MHPKIASNLREKSGAPPSSLPLKQIHSRVAGDLDAVDDMIRRQLQSDVALINQIGHYIVNSGGKRLRPIMVLLSARAFGYQGSRHIDLAAVIEFIHTATLLHDDVVDASALRRGHDTANARWGNESSVLVGDFIYSRAFEMMVDVRNMRVMEIMAHTTNVIAEGEVLQLINCHNPDTTENAYLEVIRRKTARLFEAGAQLGALLGHASPEQETAMANYGQHLGTAYQLIDDVLDFSASSEEIGKNVGDDLAEGKPTLPVIRAIQKGSPKQRIALRRVIETGGRDQIDMVMDAVESTGAIAYTAELAREEARKSMDALTALPPSSYRDALGELAEFSVSRSY